MRVPLIIEMDSGGHRLVYVQILVAALNRQNITPIIGLGPGVKESPEYRRHLTGGSYRFDACDLPDGATWSSLTRLIKRRQVDQVVIPDGENHLRLLLTRGRTEPPITALIMQDPELEVADKLSRWVKLQTKRLVLAAAAKRRSTRLLYLRGPGFRSVNENYVNDPILSDVDDTFRNQLIPLLGARPRGVFWFCLVGAISSRKHPALIAQALRSARLKNVGFLVAGPCTEQVKAELEEAGSLCRQARIPFLHIDKHLSNEEMNTVVDEVDCVVVAYSTHAPPSTLGKAAVLGTHLIIAGSAELRSHAEALGVGFGSALTVEQLARAMRIARSTDGPPPHVVISEDVFESRLLDLKGRKPA